VAPTKSASDEGGLGSAHVAPLTRLDRFAVDPPSPTRGEGK
jgi:hypothetical protein